AATLVIPILYRDFLYSGTTVPGPGHADFQSFLGGLQTGLVRSQLGADSKPVFQMAGSNLSNATNFCWWYHDTGCAGAGSTNTFEKLVFLDAGGNPTTLTLNQIMPNVYRFASNLFYPVDGLGWGNAQTNQDCGGGPQHNVAVTS